MKARAYLELGRPFTLIAPGLGFLSGAITAIGAYPRDPLSWPVLAPALLGAVMAMVFNAGSNALNQIYDLEIDRINKGKRPLPSGRLTIGEAWAYTAVAYGLTLILAWLVAPGGRHECFWIVAAAVVMTYVYSVPPLRTKRFAFWANLTIAIPRGVLLKVAGWSAVKTVVGAEPWYIGGIFGLFLLGASTTKDFADMEGDRRGGCRTLPIVYGVTRAAWMISPSFVVPFALMAQAPPAGWQWQLDRPATNVTGRDAPPGAWQFQEMIPGMHITSGPGVVVFPAGDSAAGRFMLDATIVLFPNSTGAGHGIVFGGRSLRDANATWNAKNRWPVRTSTR